MTKDDKKLIKPWLIYHGERIGYENLHIVDDSTDKDIINFYKEHAHLNFNLHRDDTGKRTLNDMQACFWKIQNSIKKGNPFFIKMDTDEFLIALDGENASCRQTNIQKAIDMESQVFWLPQLRPTTLDYLRKQNSNLLDCTSFSVTKSPRFKRSFTKKQRINLGGHNLQGLYLQSKKLAIIHFHNKKFEEHFALAKKVCISHGYINVNDNDQEIINKLKNIQNTSRHKAKFLCDVLTKKIDADKYYNGKNNDCWGKSNPISNFTELKEFKNNI